jgi:hypothetical protein
MGRGKTYKVKLSQKERDHLENIISAGEEKARKITRARILLKADADWTDKQIQVALDVSLPTIGRTRKRYVEEELSSALNRKPSSHQFERKIDGQTEAHLVAMVCSSPPAGYARWSLRLASERLVMLEQVTLESVSHETVRQVLKKTILSPGKQNNG